MDDTRTRILNAAGAVFAELGYRAATVREICRRAEVNLAAVNYHFGDKERLYAETLQHAHRFHCDRTPLPEWPADTPAETKLRIFIEVTLSWMLSAQEWSDAEGEPSWQTQLMMRAFLRPTDAERSFVEGIVRPHFELLLAILDELLPAGTPTHRRYQWGFSLIGQCKFYLSDDPIIRMLLPVDELRARFAPAQLARHIADVMLAALGRKTPPGCSEPPGG